MFGGALNFRVPGTHVDDRRLDLIAIEDISLQRLLASLSRMFVGRGRAPSGLRMLHFNHVRIHAQNPLDVTLDGEIAGRVPGDFRLAARALHVITPRDFTDAADDVTDRRAV